MWAQNTPLASLAGEEAAAPWMGVAGSASLGGLQWSFRQTPIGNSLVFTAAATQAIVELEGSVSAKAYGRESHQYEGEQVLLSISFLS